MEEYAAVRQRWERAATQYLESPDHARGDDLETLVAWTEARGSEVALDVATAVGHTALAVAPRVRRVVATDLVPEMVRQARAHAARRGIARVAFAVAAAEALPFPSGRFDLVTCRIAPHHFAGLPSAVAEFARVLRPGGLLLLEDSLAPDDPHLNAFLDCVERLRDPTHVRSLTRDEWRAQLEAAGFTIERSATFPRRHDFAAWTSRSSMSPDERAVLEQAFLAASPAAVEAFKIERADGHVVAFTDVKLLLRARR